MSPLEQPEVASETSQLVDILLVEDEAADAQLALRALERNHLSSRIHRVSDGAEALEFLFCTGAYEHRAANRNPKVVVLDLKLPLVDGLEVLRQMREDPRTRKIPVVVLTSSREERDIADSYRLGVNSYIVKPVEFEQFIEAVRQLGYYWGFLNQSPPD